MRGGQGGEWDWRPELTQLAAGSLERLGAILGPERVAALASLVLGPHSKPSAQPTCVEAWPVHDTLRQLGLYGRYRVTGAHVPVESRRAHVEALVREGQAFWSLCPFRHVAERLDVAKFGRVVDRVVRLACNREIMDEDVGSLDPPALALLGGVSEGRVRNLMSEGRAFEGSAGRVSAQSALRRLQGRPAFWNSIWQEGLSEARLPRLSPVGR